MRKAATKAMAVVLQNTWGAKNKRAFQVAVSFLLKRVRNHSLQVLATDKRLARIPPICINWEKVELDSPVTKVT